MLEVFKYVHRIKHLAVELCVIHIILHHNNHSHNLKWIKYKKCCLTLLCLLHTHTHTHTVKEPMKQTQHDIQKYYSHQPNILLLVIIMANISLSGQRTDFFCSCLCCSHAEGLNPFPSLAWAAFFSYVGSAVSPRRASRGTLWPFHIMAFQFSRLYGESDDVFGAGRHSNALLDRGWPRSISR